MNRYFWVVALSIFGLIGVSPAAALADEKDADKKEVAADKPAKKAKAVRLTKPWSGINSLTDEQKTQIADIHKKSVAEVKEVEKREREAIMAVLNDDQKAEVDAVMEKRTVERKMKKDGEAKPDAESGKAAEKAG